MNMAKASVLSAVTLAHEFGHALGLKDLSYTQNINKLMYGYSNGTATAPPRQTSGAQR